MIGPAFRPAGLAVAAILLSGSGLIGCGSQIAEPSDRPSTSATHEPSRAATGYATSYSVEEQLDQVIADIDQGREDEDVPGLAGLEVDADARTLDVYWVGEPPERIRRAIAAPPLGITVNLRPAAYDLKAMDAATEKVFTKYQRYLFDASPNDDGSGITVGWTAANAKLGPSAAEMSEVAGLPVTTEIGEPAEAVDE